MSVRFDYIERLSTPQVPLNLVHLPRGRIHVAYRHYAFGGGPGGLVGHRVVVTVGWSEGWQRREVRLDTVRLGLQGAGS
jgi:hypothetical protein